MSRFIEYINEKFLNRMPGKKAPLLVEMLFDGEADSEHSEHANALLSPESLSHELEKRAKMRSALQGYFGQIEQSGSGYGTGHSMLANDRQEIENAWAGFEKRIMADGGLVLNSKRGISSQLSGYITQAFSSSNGGFRAVGGFAFAMILAVVFVQGRGFYDGGLETHPDSSPGISPDISMGQIANRDITKEVAPSNINELDAGRLSDHLNDHGLRLESVFAGRRVIPDGGDGFHFVSNNGNTHVPDDADSRLYRLPTPNGLVEFSKSGNLGFHSNSSQWDSGSESDWDSQLISRERISEELRSQHPDN